jgi:hypothetical protein
MSTFLAVAGIKQEILGSFFRYADKQYRLPAKRSGPTVHGILDQLEADGWLTSHGAPTRTTP